MRVLVIYFSQSGGTEKIAKKIQEGINTSANSCELVKIKKVNLTKLDEYELIGLGCPTFFYREPANIQRFINNLPLKKGKYVFIFASHGSCLGNTFYYMTEQLKERGYQVIGAFDSYSDSSIQFYPSPMHTHGHPDAQELQTAQEFGEKICSVSEKVRNGQTNLIPQFELVTDTWWYRDSKVATLDLLRRISPVFIINEDKCKKCMTCQEECPGDAIDINASPPEIQKEGCIFCWACEKICPEGAIEADWTNMRLTFRGNLRKYIKLLKTAEAEGKFRPYVDYQSIK
ncbi:MAG: 4Fe-4S binding protein [Candidatus Helarchaeota archaeon]|nr:4Fe-4S binding protein [Candidatus Helarchaeota archaeon]